MRKPGLCTQNTPIHIIVCISFTVYDSRICKLHEIPYEILLKWQKLCQNSVFKQKVIYNFEIQKVI